MEVTLGRTEHPEWQAKDESLPHSLRELAHDKTKWTPRDMLIHAGWRVADAVQACGDLDSYRRYIESSKAEWSVAKNAYILGQPGWFSERSACYLAAGRPVVVQDTGFPAIFPVGEGILPFRNVDEAAAAIREVEGNYARQAKAARDVAEEYFDSDKVLSRLIEEAGSSNESSSRLTSPAPRIS
jgi:Glycosyl transferases group 1